MTVTVHGIFRRCFRINQPLQKHVVSPEKKGYFLLTADDNADAQSEKKTLGVQKLVTWTVPLKGRLCTLYTPKRRILYLRVVIFTLKVGQLL